MLLPYFFNSQLGGINSNQKMLTNVFKCVCQDIISILHIFSYRIYGLRKYEKQIREDGELCEPTKQKSIQQKNKNI